MPNNHFEQLLDQLKPVVNEPDFDQIFHSLTQDEDGPTRFQLKMELRRLVAPCLQIIDMRNRTDVKCQPVDYLGHRHYLDDTAKDIFERGLKIYDGVFTQDTYEQILAAEKDHAAQQQQEQAHAQELQAQGAERLATRQPLPGEDHFRSPYLVDTFQFGEYPYRAEERMNFTVEVKLQTPRQQCRAITSDISINGLRIRVDEPVELDIGDDLTIYFTGLAKEFTIDPDMGVPYTVVALDPQDDRTYVSLSRDTDFSDVSFDEFLSRFINGYKKRYRVNIDHTYQALLNKGHEQFLMPRLNGLPIYFSLRNKQLHADYVLTTDNNRHIVEQWINEHNQTNIGSIFNLRRSTFLLKKLLEHPERSATFITFNITARGKIYYYSALAEELIKTRLWDTFVNFAAQKSSFRVYQFRLREIDTEAAWQPQSVPLDANLPSRQQPPTSQVKQAIAPINYLGVLQDVTELMRPFTGTDYDSTQVKSLKAFMHPPAVPIRTKDIRLEFVNLRKEQRFSYRSRCRVKVGKSIREGMIMDLSVHGLKVQLDDEVNLEGKDTAYVSLSAFQKQFKLFKLQNLPYTIVNADHSRTTLNLRVPDDQPQHSGADFFGHLIKEHRDQLRLLHENTSLNGIELCLRNLYCQAPATVPLFMHRDKKHQVTLRRAGLSNWSSHWHQLLFSLPGSNINSLNIQPVLRGSSLATQILPELRERSRSDRPLQKLLLIKLYRDAEEAIMQTQWQTVEAEDTSMINAFIDQCLPAGVFFAIRVDLSRTGRPDIQFVQAELNYLSLYAAHRAHELEEELWQVYALADTFDVTDDILKFADLSNEEFRQQQQRRRQWLDH